MRMSRNLKKINMTHAFRYEVRGEVLNRPLLRVTNVSVVVIDSAIRPGTWDQLFSLEVCRQSWAQNLIPDHVVWIVSRSCIKPSSRREVSSGSCSSLSSSVRDLHCTLRPLQGSLVIYAHFMSCLHVSLHIPSLSFLVNGSIYVLP